MRPGLSALAIVVGAIWGTCVFVFLKQEIVVQPRIVSLGDVRPGQTYLAAFLFRNQTHATLQLLGAQSDCNCVAVSGFPRTIMAGVTQRLVFEVHVPVDQPAGFFERRIRILSAQYGWGDTLCVSGIIPASKL